VAPVLKTLASHESSNSPDHNAKGTQSGDDTGEPAPLPPTACQHVVSGSLSLPAQGCFSPVPHGTRPLSVTQESLALEGGPPSFTPDYSGRALLRNSTTRTRASPTGLSPSLAPRSRGLPLPSVRASVGPTTPIPQGDRFGLGPVRSPLLRTSRLISLPPGTEMFQFPGFASFRRTMTGSLPPGFPIRQSKDRCVRAAPLGLSQLITAFIASVCPGIPHMLSLA
jgi:hypothetical protein